MFLAAILRPFDPGRQHFNTWELICLKILSGTVNVCRSYSQKKPILSIYILRCQAYAMTINRNISAGSITYPQNLNPYVYKITVFLLLQQQQLLLLLSTVNFLPPSDVNSVVSVDAWDVTNGDVAILLPGNSLTDFHKQTLSFIRQTKTAAKSNLFSHGCVFTDRFGSSAIH